MKVSAKTVAMAMVVVVVVAMLVTYFVAWALASDVRNVTDAGWVLYHSKTCGHCVTQLADLGWKTHWLESVECTASTACRSRGITVFPTWLNEKTNQMMEGRVDADKLVTTLMEAPVRRKIATVIKDEQILTFS